MVATNHQPLGFPPVTNNLKAFAAHYHFSQILMLPMDSTILSRAHGCINPLSVCNQESPFPRGRSVWLFQRPACFPFESSQQHGVRQPTGAYVARGTAFVFPWAPDFENPSIIAPNCINPRARKTVRSNICSMFGAAAVICAGNYKLLAQSSPKASLTNQSAALEISSWCKPSSSGRVLSVRVTLKAASKVRPTGDQNTDEVVETWPMEILFPITLFSQHLFLFDGPFHY
jgi:hypothetical protein